MVHNGCNYFSFWAIFCPYTPTPNSPKNQNFEMAWRYHQFTYVYQKLRLDEKQFLRYGVQWMDEQTEGHMEKMTYRGGCLT